MPYNLRSRKNRRFKPEPPNEPDDSSDSDYMLFDTDDEDTKNKKRKTHPQKGKRRGNKEKESEKKEKEKEDRGPKNQRIKKKSVKTKEDTPVLSKKESPFEKVLQKLMNEHLPESESGQRGKNTIMTMQFLVDDEDDPDYDPDEDDGDYEDDEEDEGGFVVGGLGSLFGRSRNPYDIRLPASKMTPELLTYLQKMPSLLGSSHKSGDDIKGFRNLKKHDQKQIVESLKKMVNTEKEEEHPYFKILRLPLDSESKRAAMEKQKQVIDSENSPMGEVNVKLQNWVRGFLKIPFGTYSTIPKRAKKNPSKYLKNASDILDKEVYGLDDAKDHILRYVAQTITNPSAAGNCLAMLGPPGTGKTSLIKDALGKILNRPVHMIALGGNTDSSFLEGHSYTYEGSLWGQIADILMKSKCMNPVIIFDELDKVSKTQKGDEIIGILTHMTDSTQNRGFQDKYFAGINIDLSRVLFVFTMNDRNAVNSVLLDRLRIIHTKGYSKKEKRIIGEKYLLPRILKEYSINTLEISDEAWNFILDERDEPGVRNVKRDLETIVSRLNIHRLLKGEQAIKGVPSGLQWKEGATLSRDDTSILLGNRDDGKTKPPIGMYC
jgi:DNA replication protein DnaC